MCGGLGGELEKIEKKFRSRTVNVFEKWFLKIEIGFGLLKTWMLN